MSRTKLSAAMPDGSPSPSLLSQRIFNLPLSLFAIALIVMAGAIATDTLPSGMIGALLVMMLLGELLGFAGDRLPIIKTYLGGGAILALFGAAAMVYFGWLPAAVAVDVATFMKGGGFLDFYIAALITGSILGMDAKVLVKVGSRYALPLLCSVLFAALFAMAVGALLGFSAQDAVVVIESPLVS